MRHVVARAGFGDALGSLAKEVGAIRVMLPAERELREDPDLEEALRMEIGESNEEWEKISE